MPRSGKGAGCVRGSRVFLVGDWAVDAEVVESFVERQARTWCSKRFGVTRCPR